MFPRRFQVVILGLALLLGIVVGAWGAVLTSDTASSASVNQVRTLIETQRASTHHAEQQRRSESKSNALAFAVILENLAAAFGTPPAPDAGRLKAVDGLCETARTFRAVAGDTHPPACPATGP